MPHHPAIAELRDFYGLNQPFDPSPYPDHCEGWGSTSPHFEWLVERFKPIFIIEVGTWLGASAIHMMNLARPRRMGTHLVAVDTWLGAGEFVRLGATQDRNLRIDRGYPDVYHHCRANIARNKMEDCITLFPTTSLIAARWFKARQFWANMIYIDGSHDREDVWHDLHAYWPLTPANGVLFGDDLSWAGVRAATAEFAKEIRLPRWDWENKWAFCTSPLAAPWVPSK